MVKQMTDLIVKTLLLAFLGAASYMDAKKHELNIFYLAAGLVSGAMLETAIAGKEWYEPLLGCLTGVVLLIISLITRGSCGYGDACLITAAGAFLGWNENIMLIVFSFIAAALGGAFLLIFKKKKIKDSIAFAPFVLGGYVFMLGLGI